MRVTLGTFETTDKIQQAVSAVLDSGRISYGPVSQRFEKEFAARHDCKHGVLTNSGTSSLVVALQALKELHGWQDGDEVIVPALTFVATVNAVLHNQLTPVLVDVNPATYNIDASKIGQAITKRTRCIMPVHLFGQPCEIWHVVNIARNYGLSVIEDSCETMLAKYNARSVGDWGDIGCFSTYAAHLLVTGVGGICTTNNTDYAKKMRSLVNHGIDLAELPDGSKYDPTFLARKFRFTSVGHSFRMTEIEAAIGLAQLEELPDMIAKRRQNAGILTQLLTPLANHFCLPGVAKLATHSYMMFPIVLHNGCKWPVMHHLQQSGIETREMVPLTNQPCYNFNEDDWPVAKWINQSGFYVGCHQGLDKAHMEHIAKTLSEYFT